MSELIDVRGRQANLRWKLLATASGLALIGGVSASSAAYAGEADRPTVWIEVGGQLERVAADHQPFAPAFTNQFLSDKLLSAASLEKAPRYSNGFEGSITIDPRDSDWAFVASVRYGRSNATRTSHNQPAPPVLHGIISIPAFGIYRTVTGIPAALRFADASSRGDERHLLLDFTAGRDVGVGGAGKSLSFNAGVRVAQFTSKSNVKMTANPGGIVPYKYATQFAGGAAYIHAPNFSSEDWDIYHATASISRSFKGVGPTLSLNESVTMLGGPDTMAVSIDFGANGAILFGRQKTDIHYKVHDDAPIIPHSGNFKPMTAVYHHTYDPVRSRSVIVPNVGGFAGLSFNYANAKLKLGYRADFFFGAMDGGIDMRKTYDRNFYGPFASISIGLGG